MGFAAFVQGAGGLHIHPKFDLSPSDLRSYQTVQWEGMQQGDNGVKRRWGSP